MRVLIALLAYLATVLSLTLQAGCAYVASPIREIEVAVKPIRTKNYTLHKQQTASVGDALLAVVHHGQPVFDSSRGVVEGLVKGCVIWLLGGGELPGVGRQGLGAAGQLVDSDVLKMG
jgi:hypothetical protein